MAPCVGRQSIWPHFIVVRVMEGPGDSPSHCLDLVGSVMLRPKPWNEWERQKWRVARGTFKPGVSDLGIFVCIKRHVIKDPRLSRAR